MKIAGLLTGLAGWAVLGTIFYLAFTVKDTPSSVKVVLVGFVAFLIYAIIDGRGTN